MAFESLLKRELDLYYQQKRRKNEARTNAAKAKLYSDGNFVSALNAYRSENFEYSKAKYNGDEKAALIHEANAKKIKNELLAAAEKSGVKKSDLKPKYDCKLCNDTGFTKNGEKCSCYNLALKKIAFDALGIETPVLPSFENSKYEDKNGLKKIYDKIRVYCEKFTPSTAKNIVVSGDVGTGKSFLAGAIVTQVEKAGYNPIFITAQNLNNVFLKYHTAPIDEKSLYSSLLCDCDLLVIDDLGCEPPFKNVTNEYLLMVLCERTAKSLPTIITTNLSQNQLLDRYGDRVLSRLNDKRRGSFIEIKGEDLRRLK